MSIHFRRNAVPVILALLLLVLCMPLSCMAQSRPTVAMAVIRGDTTAYLMFCNLSDSTIKVPYALIESTANDMTKQGMLIHVDTVHSPFVIRTCRSETGDTNASTSKYRYMAVRLKPKECYSIPLQGYDARRVVDFIVVAGPYRESFVLNTIRLINLPAFVQKVEW